jgi:hypothetical protein
MIIALTTISCRIYVISRVAVTHRIHPEEYYLKSYKNIKRQQEFANKQWQQDDKQPGPNKKQQQHIMATSTSKQQQTRMTNDENLPQFLSTIG